MISKESPSGLVGTIALIVLLVIGYFLFREEEKKEPIMEIDNEMIWVLDNSIQTPNIPYIPHIQSLGFLVELEKYDWDVRIMRAILLAESSGNPNAVNKTDKHKTCNGSYGVLQIGCVHIGKHIEEKDLLDLEKNIEAGYKIWIEQGYGAWGAYKNKSYLKYL